MLINNFNLIRDKKYLLLLVIIDILKENSDPEHHMTKQELLQKIEETCGFAPARNTLYDKLDSLEAAGFPVVQDRNDGVYYDGHELSDGEMRFLVDSILYSDFVTHKGAGEMIEALAAFGSTDFQKYIRRQKSRAEKSRKNTKAGIFYTIETVQSAIFEKRKISCNYLTYRADLTTECVYPEDITVNPYELVCKNGKYYLLGSMDDNDNMLSWRVDWLCNVEKLKGRCREIPLLKEIHASGGMSAYVDQQPDLCGGVVETFKIQCSRNAIDEIIDVFGTDFSIAPEQKDNDDDETVILSVKATRESMKAWAFAHSDCMVVVAPDDFRTEIFEALSDAKRLYTVTGKPLYVRMFTAKSLPTAIRFAQKRAGKTLVYHGKGTRHERECIDLSELTNMPDLTSFSVTNCILEHTEYLNQLPMLRRLSIVDCQYDTDAFDGLSCLTELQTDDEALAVQLGSSSGTERLTLLGSQITDASRIAGLPSVRRLSLVHCRELKDCNALENADHIKKLEITDCDKVLDFSFLEHMPNLKSIFIDSKHFTIDDGFRLHEKTGAEVHICHLRDLDDETKKKLGIAHTPRNK